MAFLIKSYYDSGECPDCGDDIPDDIIEGESCDNCGHVFWVIEDDDAKEE